MSEIIDRLATAAYEAYCAAVGARNFGPWTELPEFSKNITRVQARAVLEAARDLTNEQMLAGEQAYWELRKEDPGAQPGGRIWDAMIDEALRPWTIEKCAPTVADLMALPELPPSPARVKSGTLGLDHGAGEGEYSWADESLRPWWTETVDGIRYRRTYSAELVRHWASTADDYWSCFNPRDRNDGAKT